jgi:hypothetical protein
LEDDAITATGSGTGIVGVQTTGNGITTVVDSLVFAQSTGTSNFGAAVASDGGTSVDVIDSRLSVLATGTSGFGTALSINGDGSVIGSRLKGDGGAGSAGFGAIDNGSSSTLTIDSSHVEGSLRAVGAAATDKILIGASKVIGGHDAAAAGTVTCIFSYKADYTATNSTCD